MNKSKRTQAGIITTVLIILIVLAAVVIVWNVVRKVTTDKAGQIDVSIVATQLDVVKNSVIIDSTKLQLSVARGSDQANLSMVKIILEGQTKTGEERRYTYNFTNVPDSLGVGVYTMQLHDINETKVKKISIYAVSQTGNIGPSANYQTTGSEQIKTITTPGQLPETCTPLCTGKQCGDDGCGGLCGGCICNGTFRSSPYMTYASFHTSEELVGTGECLPIGTWTSNYPYRIRFTATSNPSLAGKEFNITTAADNDARWEMTATCWGTIAKNCSDIVYSTPCIDFTRNHCTWAGGYNGQGPCISAVSGGLTSCSQIMVQSSGSTFCKSMGCTFGWDMISLGNYPITVQNGPPINGVAGDKFQVFRN